MPGGPSNDTRARIVEAADELLDEAGGNIDAVTLDLVQARAGRGSRTTVSAVVREWKLDKQLPSSLLEREAPAAAQEAAKAMWESAKRVAAAEFDDVRRTLQAKVDETLARMRDVDALARDQQQIAASVQAELVEMKAQLDAERRAREAVSVRAEEVESGLREQIRIFREHAHEAEQRAASEINKSQLQAQREIVDLKGRIDGLIGNLEKAEDRNDALRERVSEMREHIAAEKAFRGAAESRVLVAEKLATEKMVALSLMSEILKETRSDLEARDATNRELHQALGKTEKALYSAEGQVVALTARLIRADEIMRSGSIRRPRWLRNRAAGSSL